MSFLDDLQSPLTLRAFLRYVECFICGEQVQLSPSELGKNFDSKYICPNCEALNAPRRKSETSKSSR